MDNFPRFLFYASGIVIISAALILFTSGLLAQINNNGFIGFVFLFGYGLVYMNLVFVISRRFMRRLSGASNTPYIFGFLIALPPIIWVNIFDANLGESHLIFMLMIAIGCALGAFLGYRAGLKAQLQFQEKLHEYLNQDE